MKAALLALLIWQAGPQADGGAPLTPAAFRDRLVMAMTKESGQAVAPVDDRTFRTRRADGTELTVSIDNAYASYLADPAQLDAVVARYVRVLAAPAEDGATLDRLVVIVRPSDYLARSLPPGASTANFVPPRPFGGDLSLFLAIDSPDAIRTAQPTDLKRWRIDADAAWRRAIANGKARVGPLQPTRLGDADGATGFGAASGLAPSVLADPAVCGPTAPDRSNRQLVLVYARDLFLYALPSDEPGLRQFWRTVRAEVAANRSLSSTVLTCRAGRWTTVPVPTIR